jgi:hypothetical protein
MRHDHLVAVVVRMGIAPKLHILSKPQQPGRRRVLDLQPRLGRPRSVRVAPVLRDNAFESKPASVLEDRLTVPDEVLVVLDARVGDLPK